MLSGIPQLKGLQAKANLLSWQGDKGDVWKAGPQAVQGMQQRARAEGHIVHGSPRVPELAGSHSLQRDQPRRISRCLNISSGKNEGDLPQAGGFLSSPAF